MGAAGGRSVGGRYKSAAVGPQAAILRDEHERGGGGGGSELSRAGLGTPRGAPRWGHPFPTPALHLRAPGGAQQPPQAPPPAPPRPLPARCAAAAPHGGAERGEAAPGAAPGRGERPGLQRAGGHDARGGRDTRGGLRHRHGDTPGTHGDTPDTQCDVPARGGSAAEDGWDTLDSQWDAGGDTHGCLLPPPAAVTHPAAPRPRCPLRGTRDPRPAQGDNPKTVTAASGWHLAPPCAHRRGLGAAPDLLDWYLCLWWWPQGGPPCTHGCPLGLLWVSAPMGAPDLSPTDTMGHITLTLGTPWGPSPWPQGCDVHPAPMGAPDLDPMDAMEPITLAQGMLWVSAPMGALHLSPTDTVGPITLASGL